MVLTLFGCIYHCGCRWTEFTLACETFDGLSLETSHPITCAALEFCPCPRPGVNFQQKGESHHFFSLSRHLSTCLEECGFPANGFRPRQFWLERSMAYWWGGAGRTSLPLHGSCHHRQGIAQELPVVSLPRLSARLKRTSVDCSHVRTRREPSLRSGPFAFQMGKLRLRKAEHRTQRYVEAKPRLLALFSVQAARTPWSQTPSCRVGLNISLPRDIHSHFQIHGSTPSKLLGSGLGPIGNFPVLVSHIGYFPAEAESASVSRSHVCCSAFFVLDRLLSYRDSRVFEPLTATLLPCVSVALAPRAAP